MTFISEDQKWTATDTRGRVRVSDERRESLLDDFERSGMSGVKFAKLAGVKYPIPRPRDVVGAEAAQGARGAGETGWAGGTWSKRWWRGRRGAVRHDPMGDTRRAGLSAKSSVKERPHGKGQGYDVYDPVWVQIKTVKNPNGAYQDMKKAVDDLVTHSPADKPLQLHILVKEENEAADLLKTAVQDYID